MPEMEEPTREPTRIIVEGTPYALPSLDTFDLEEAMVMYKYSDLTFDAIFELEGLHPGVVAGLIHVAIQRSDPALREREVRAMVKAVNMMSVLEQLAAAAEDAPDPTQAEVEQPLPDLPTSKLDPTEPSGDDSGTASALFPERSSPGSSGTLGSDMPATSDPLTSAR